MDWLAGSADLSWALSYMPRGHLTLSSSTKASTVPYVSSPDSIAWPGSPGNHRGVEEKAERHKGFLNLLFVASVPTSYRPMGVHEGQIPVMRKEAPSLSFFKIVVDLQHHFSFRCTAE